MNWKIIDFRHRTLQTVAGTCSVFECSPGDYILSLNRKELLGYNASGWDDAMQRAKYQLLIIANTASSCVPWWKNNWTALTPLGLLTVKLWSDSYMVKLGNKVIHDIEIVDMLHPLTTAHTIRMHAEDAFRKLAKDLAAELS